MSCFKAVISSEIRLCDGFSVKLPSVSSGIWSCRVRVPVEFPYLHRESGVYRNYLHDCERQSRSSFHGGCDNSPLKNETAASILSSKTLKLESKKYVSLSLCLLCLALFSFLS